MTSAKSTNSKSLIHSDGLFTATLAVLGGTYVLLILLLLAGDLVYLFTTPVTVEETITFDPGEDSPQSNKEERLLESIAPYGMTIESEVPLSIFDSAKPINDEWGSPHRDYGGPGTGTGGQSSAAYSNDKHLGNILAPNAIDDETPGALVFHWDQPIEVNGLQILAGKKPVDISFYKNDKKMQSVTTPAGDGPGSFHAIKLAGIESNKLKLLFRDGGGVATLQFSWPGRLRSSWELKYPILSAVIYNPMTQALAKPEIQYSIALSLVSCTITAIISIWIAVPLGYLLSRYSFIGKRFVDAILDIPIILPPLVVGLSLLILFQFSPITLRDAVVYQIPAVILAQVAVACAFAVRTMKAAFDQIDPRYEQVALTLGCSQATAFSRVVLPEAIPGILTAGTLAWARALGEFGPLLIFAGATRYKTEVLSTSVFLELSVGDLSAAVAISMIMVIAAIIVLILTRVWGTRTISL